MPPPPLSLMISAVPPSHGARPSNGAPQSDGRGPLWLHYHFTEDNTFCTLAAPLAERPKGWLQERGHYSNPLPSTLYASSSRSDTSNIEKLDHILFASDTAEDETGSKRRDTDASSANAGGNVAVRTKGRPSKEKRIRHRLLVERLGREIEADPEGVDIMSLPIPEFVLGNDWLRAKLFQRLERHRAALLGERGTVLSSTACQGSASASSAAAPPGACPGRGGVAPGAKVCCDRRARGWLPQAQ
uniref:Uncharacterized protein n=1 Tax=Pyrodinium bahamense TaxID=73915 RepID=A0A7R9ZVY5_9DINO|mmetsp:Transcript_12083/g.33136  ORF Transcript_12083/g.33136 Transcript_12083/m.33136 type:complete len:244 (+) Transcript_12083:28-759(+)